MSAQIHTLKPKQPDMRDDFEKLREVWRHEPVEQDSDPFLPLWWKAVVIFDLGLIVVFGLFVLARYMSQ